MEEFGTIANAMIEPQDPRYKRRIRFSLAIITSQMLLLALALGWGLYLISISQNGGEILSTENNQFILYGEIILTGLIIVFATIVAVMEIQRMNSRRLDEKTPKPRPKLDCESSSTLHDSDSDQNKVSQTTSRNR